MSNTLVELAETVLTTAETFAPSDAKIVASSLGLSRGSLAAAAAENPYVAVAGVLVGAAGAASAREAMAGAVATVAVEFGLTEAQAALLQRPGEINDSDFDQSPVTDRYEIAYMTRGRRRRDGRGYCR